MAEPNRLEHSAPNNKNASPVNIKGQPAMNTAELQARGGFVASCKAFFTRVFARGNRQTLSTMNTVKQDTVAANQNGVIAAQTRTNKPNWFKKLFNSNPNKRRRVPSPFVRKAKKGKDNSINIGNIGRPADNKKNQKFSQAPPSEHVDAIDVPDLLRKESTTILAGHGRAYESVMANPSVFVEGADLASLRVNIAKHEAEKEANHSVSPAQQRFREINNNAGVSPTPFNSVESPPFSPVESPKEKPRDEEALDRFSLGSSVKSGTVRGPSGEEYLQDLDDDTALVPIDRTPGMKSIKRRSSQKKNKEIMLPARAELTQRQAVSADAASFDAIRVASADKFTPQPQQRALSADSFPIPLKKDPRASANTSVSANSDQASHITPVTLLNREVSGNKTTLERSKNSGKGLFSSFRGGRKKKKEPVLSSGEDPVNILTSRNYQETIKKKKKAGKIRQESAEDQSHLLMSPAYAKTKARQKKKKGKIKPMALTPEEI